MAAANSRAGHRPLPHPQKSGIPRRSSLAWLLSCCFWPACSAGITAASRRSWSLPAPRRPPPSPMSRAASPRRRPGGAYMWTISTCPWTAPSKFPATSPIPTGAFRWNTWNRWSPWIRKCPSQWSRWTPGRFCCGSRAARRCPSPGYISRAPSSATGAMSGISRPGSTAAWRSRWSWTASPSTSPSGWNSPTSCPTRCPRGRWSSTWTTGRR